LNHQRLKLGVEQDGIV